MNKSGNTHDRKPDGITIPMEEMTDGASIIAEQARLLPDKPGVYCMLDAKGTVLYVGKAYHLKKRVQNYTRPERQTRRIARMITLTKNVEFIITETEAAALLLEANMIQRHKPRFNIVLRDNKSFPYILITRNNYAPRLMKHRGARSQPGDYFGPFASAGAVDRTIKALQNAFMLRSCPDTVYANRTRPCLLYQIKRCSAPCTAEISHKEYDELVCEVSDFLTGRSRKVKKRLVNIMQQASDALDFERAATCRDRLAALGHIQSHQEIATNIEEADIFAIHQKNEQNCIQVCLCRNGQNWGNKAYFPHSEENVSKEEVLTAFIAQFYNKNLPPSLILLAMDISERQLLEKALRIRTGRNIIIAVPKRGTKHVMTRQAMNNARETLKYRMEKNTNQRKLLKQLAETFDMGSLPKRIEVYDNSHLQGSLAVGCMIVAGLDGFIKNQYRKFNIKSSSMSAGDDCSMMREVLTRRFAHIKEDINGQNQKQTDYDPVIPDLIIVDGGAGQMNTAHNVLTTLGLEKITIIGMAKGKDRNAGREHFYMIQREVFMLEEKSAVLYFMQRLRDEAHRFAVGSHGVRRRILVKSSSISKVPGIGINRKRALLRHFGSVKAVSKACKLDLEAVEGIGSQMAQIIYEHFHNQRN